MKDINFLSAWVKRFLSEYLISMKNLSRNTQQSYRDTFRLCIPFIANKKRKSIDKLNVKDMSPAIIKLFLLHLETTRCCSLMTRNQRLAAIRTFSEFIGINSPEHIEWCRKIHFIPFKKTKHALITYLEKPEMDALLDAPNYKTKLGRRDYALLLFSYNTGARASEVVQLKIGDLDIDLNTSRSISVVSIQGKGNKLRRCPLWKETVIELNKLIVNRSENEYVFLNRCFKPLTRYGIYAVVKKYAKKLFSKIPALKKKSISPHVIRHTTATHLLRSGVDINTVRVWLGHVSIDTTNIYAEVDLDMKKKALACCDNNSNKKQNKHWRDDKGLMAFLKNL